MAFGWVVMCPSSRKASTSSPKHTCTIISSVRDLTLRPEPYSRGGPAHKARADGERTDERRTSPGTVGAWSGAYATAMRWQTGWRSMPAQREKLEARLCLGAVDETRQARGAPFAAGLLAAAHPGEMRRCSAGKVSKSQPCYTAMPVPPANVLF